MKGGKCSIVSKNYHNNGLGHSGEPLGMKTPAIALTAACLCAPLFAAEPEPYSNWYFSMSALSNLSLDDGSFDVDTPPTSLATILNFPLLDTGGLLTLTPGTSNSFATSYDEDSNAVRFSLGKNFRQRYRLELEYSESVNDINEVGSVDASGELRIESFFANGWLDFRPGKSWQPYIGLGVGQSRIALGDTFDDAVTYQAGAGVSWTPIPILTLDLGYRHIESDEVELEFDNGQLNSEFSGNAIALNIRFNFFASRRARSIDQLPASRTDAEPECLAGSSCSDIDQDGLTDDRDQCPDTRIGTAINVEGCADRDGDNVADIRDQCPDTPRGSPVMSNGCAAQQSAILQGVNFEFGSAQLTFSAKLILNRVAEALQRSPDFAIDIQGHTDDRGSDETNNRLSEDRARQVAAYLISRGINPERLNSKGMGEGAPIANNSTADGRATNRRVEIMVLDYQER